MRDRLIELLQSKYDHFCDQCGVNKQTSYIKNLADYLLANGVIVLPPIKMGDAVWMIWATTNDKLEIVKREVVRDTVKSFTIELNGDAYFETERSCFYAEHIGRKVFFTKEAAEQAMRQEGYVV